VLLNFTAKKEPKTEQSEYMKAIKDINKLNKRSAAFVSIKFLQNVLYPNRNKQGGFIG
jgi:hypothetical protein